MSYITNETERQDVKKAIANIVDSLTRQEAEKDCQKAIKAELKEKYGIPPRQAGRLAKMILKNNLAQETEEFNVLEELFVQVQK